MTGPLPDSFGPYRVVEELGRGGMGVVYRVRRDDLDREFALKLVVGGGGSEHDGDSAARLGREARAAARLADIPGIVGVHDVGEQDGRVYLVMDLVPGRALDTVLRDDDVAPQQAAEWVAQVAEALEQAHARGVLHRDVKPANVLLDGAGRAALTDFGLAKWTKAEGELSRLTASGAILGTPAYMAPEQARGESLDARADVYALGVTLYEALAGRPPFDDDTMLAVIHRVLREPPRPLHQARPGVPRPLAAIAHRAMAKEPAARYPSAGALAADLRRWLAGEPVEARLPGPGARIAALLRRRRGLAVGLCLTGAAAVALAVAVPRLRAGEADSTLKLKDSAAEVAAVNRLGASLAAYRELVQRTLPHLQRLEDLWRNVRVTEQERAAALAAIDAVVAEVAARHPGTRAPEAWRVLAHGFADDPDAPARLRAMGTAASEDPIPSLLLAQILLSRYGAGADLPAIAMSTGEQVVEPYRESAAQRSWREQALAALKLVQGLPGWSALDEAARYADLARGTEALAGGRYAEAAGAFARLRDDPLLGATAADLQGLSLYADDQYAAAGAAWQQVAERGWPGGMVNGANAWVSEGVAAGLRDEPAAEPYEHAIALLDRALPVTDRRAYIFTARGTARLYLAAALPRLGRGGFDAVDAVLTESVADYRRATAESEVADAHAGLGQGLMHLAQHHERNGRDPRALMEQAVAAFGRALDLDPDYWIALLNRATVLRRQADLLARSADAGALYERSLQDLGRIKAVGAAEYPVLLETAYTELSRGRAAIRYPGSDPAIPLQRAVEAAGKALTVRRDAVQALQVRAAAAEALGRLVGLRGEDATPHFAAAERDLSRALERAPGEAAIWRDRGVIRYRRSATLRHDADERVAQLAAARDDYRQAIARGLDNAGMKLNVGNTWLSEGDVRRRTGGDPQPAWTEAEREYTAAIALNPRDGRIWSMRARLRQQRAAHAFRRGQPHLDIAATALADYEETVRLMPRDPGPWGERGRLLAGAGRLGEAAESLERAVALSNGEKKWTDLLARVRREMGK